MRDASFQRFFRRLLRAVAFLAAGLTVRGATEPVTPGASEEKLRELNTDRPDVTESPFTVDPGHTQLEMDFVSLGQNRQEVGRTRELSAGDFNLRLGVSRSFEVGVFATPYLRHSEKPGRTTSGLGDTMLRGKWNFWGDDGGETAFGLIVDVLLPTAARGLGESHAQAAVTLPVSIDLGHGWDLGAMTEVEGAYRETGDYHAVWTNTVTVGHEIAGPVAGYAEVASTTGEGGHIATFDVGLTWKLDGNTQLDAGTNIGITRAADDLVVFTGLSRRF